MRVKIETWVSERGKYTKNLQSYKEYFILFLFYFILFYLFNSLAFVISRINNIGEYYSNVKINLIP